ncbi:MAG: right-handed parallel beta-helix repeat-containing protein, partial [Burkholderiales bacterium]|nr:right-handed parallel beta-helix repeat-containing protein [Opitutaceae bacterium]
MSFAFPRRLLASRPALRWLFAFASFVLALASGATGARAATIYVRADATAGGNGASWATAYNSLQTALTQVNGTTPTEIWIAAGVYKPTSGLDRSVSFVLKSNLTLRGGFFGTETTASQRPASSAATAFTVLSGDIGDPQSDAIGVFSDVNSFVSTFFDVTASGAKDNSFNVLRASGLSGVTLDRIVVAGGYANYHAITQYQIENILRPSYPPNDGPGFEEPVSKPMYNRVCGGALHAYNSSIAISDCWLVGNFASGLGGAIATRGGFISIQNSRVVRNVARQGGGGAALQSTEVAVIGNTFYGNSTSFLGAGLLIQADNGAKQLKTYESALLDSLAALTSVNPDTTPPDILDGPSTAYDQAKLLKSLSSIGTSIASALIKPVIVAAATNGVTIATKVATLSLANAPNLLGTAYGALSLGVALGDVAVQVALYYGADPDNVHLQNYMAFSEAFNTYLTPVGWAKLIAAAAYTPKTPSLEERASTRRYKEYMLLQNKTPRYTLSHNRFEANASAGMGGAIATLHANVLISQSWFVKNTAMFGGSGGAFFCYNETWIESSAFIDNTAEYGNTLTFGFRALGRIIHNTIVGNHTDNAHGHAVSADAGADVSLINTVLWGNTSGKIADTTNPNRFGGADLFATRYEDLSAAGQQAYRDADDGYGSLIAVIDAQVCDIQGLDRLITGKATFFLGGGSIEHEDYNGILAAGVRPNVGEGIRPLAGRGNFSRDPILAGRIYPHPSLSPLLNVGRRDLSWGGSHLAFESEREYGAYGGGPEVGVIESDGALPPATILYVNAAAAASGDGFTWSTAFKTIHEACAVAVAPGAQIWVAPGTYYPTSGADRSATLYLRRGVTLVGSLPVGSSSIAQSNPAGATLTIISGDIGVPSVASDNSRGLVSGRDFDFYTVTKGTELPRVIRGIRFTGTEGNGTSSAVQLAAPAIIQFCTFDYNLGSRALTLDEPDGVEEETYARIEDSTFESNNAGAIDCFTYNLDIYRCRFFDNTAPNGAALFKRNGRVHTSLTVERSVFYNNIATSGRGAAIDSQDWTLELVHNVFADNIATLPASETSNRGAGVWWGIDSSSWNTPGRLSLLNNIFSGNRFNWPHHATGVEFQQFGYGTPTGQRFEFTISGNNIEGLDALATLAGSSGNVDFDPFFVDKVIHDFHLRDNSYLINRGVSLTSGTDATVQIGNRDIGLYENATITAIAAPQPVIFTALPATEDGRIYTLQVASGVTGAQNYRWQIRRTDGSGFVNITADDAPALTGFATDTLTFTNPGRDLNGCAFRLMFTGTNANLALYSAAHTLNVTPGVLYVVPGGAGLKNGGSWANAYAFVNQACDNAVDGTQIWIARGTYGTGRYQPGITVINQNYATIPAGVSLYGGFVGTETSLSQRPAFDVDTTPDAQRTLLTKGDSNIQLINISGSGTVANRIDRITFFGSGGPTGIALVATNAKVQLTNVRNHYVAQGMRFTNSHVTLTDTRHAFNNGTALVFYSSTATLSRVRAESNGASGHGNQSGGIVASDSSLTIADSLIAQNKGLYAGGLQIYGASSLDVQRTLFRGNMSVGANQGGGAINFGSTVSGQVANSLFQDNLTGGVTVTGNSGSAVRTTGSATLTLRHCTIVGNRVDRGGGAPLHGASGTLAVVNSIVWGNTAEGASVVTQGNVTVTSSYVQGQAPLGFYEPFFVDPAASDYRLTYASPMRDLVIEDQSGLGSTDLAGLARRRFHGVDLGAYEFATVATGIVPVLSRPAAAVVYAQNPVSFTLTAASTFRWEYFTGGLWLPVSGHDGWSTSATPVTTNGIAATAFTLTHAAVPAAYAATPIQLRARSIDNFDFSIPALLTVNARHVLRVNASAASSGGNGLSWATAFNSVSAALAAANAGTDLWISAGDYLESYTPAVQFVRYYPGFVGTESLVTERNAVTHPVYLASSVSKLPYNPADSRTAPVNTHQFTTAPASVAAYVDRPASFLVTTPAEVVWQSSNDGVTWLNIGSTPGWSASVSGTAKTLSLAAVTAPLNGLRLRAIVATTGEFSGFAFLTATPRHVLYVNAAAAAGGNGQSWATAFNNIAAALAAADDGADIWIATGVYSAPAVSVPAGTKLYSGFAGTETTFDQRDPATYPVVFNGGASSLTLPADASVPSSVYQLTAAPVSTTVYAENPASFSATAAATVAWQYSANGGSTWSDISGLSGWTTTVAGGVSTLASSAASTGQTNHRFRAVITATGETSPAAILTVNGRAVRYVRASAPASPAPTGLSWATAYRTISAALATAHAGTDLWIAAGDYTETSLPTVALVRYYPGFAGTETLVTQRDPVASPVRLVGAYSFLPYAPADVRTAPANLHQITAAPANAAPYVDRPVAFSAGSGAALVWQYSTDTGTTWSPLSNLSGWTVSIDAPTGASVASLAAVTADLNNLRLRATIGATGESAFTATLTATPRVILHVDGRVAASGDGLSWNTAFKTLSDALAAAHEGTDLWIAAGTYSELQLLIPEGAKLYPGFAGTETDFGQRNTSANTVRIQGSAGTSSFTGASSISALRFNIVTAPRDAAPYIANPVSLSATRAAWSVATLAWEYSADDGATWQTAVGLADWTITTTGATTTISHPAVPAELDGLRFRAVASSVDEISASATLIVKARVTRYVRSDAPSSPTPNGQSWSTAYRTVSAALAAIDNGTDLWIAAGDYAEPTLHFVSGSAIYGGFAGTESLFSERDLAANIVTLRSTGGPVFATDLATLGALSGATQLDGVTLALGAAPGG